jgi:hypothetical protein
LDVECASLINHANEALKKFDPNEPRDARGRWATGGGSSSNNAGLPTGGQRIPVADYRTPRGWGTDESRLAINWMTKNCINTTQSPKFKNKVKKCLNFGVQFQWLSDVNSESWSRIDGCISLMAR